MEFFGFIGATGGIAVGVGVCADAGEFPFISDEVFIADGSTVEEALENFANPCGVAVLGGEGRPGDVGRHRIIRHRPPGMIFG